MLKIYAHKTDPNAIIPQVAYNGTSAAFDITCTKSTTIPARGSAKVPCGLNLVIPDTEKYYMRIDLRSSMGFKQELVPHSGIIDAGYTGDLGTKIYNLGDTDVYIALGDRYAQITVLPRPYYVIEEIDDHNFQILKDKQLRGDGREGSSGK